MVAEQSQPETGTQEGRRRARPGTAARLPAAIAFLAGLGVVLLYALSGGAYDAVTFQEYGLVIWILVAAPLGLGLLPWRRPSAPVAAVCGALLTYAIWIALSLIWTESPERTMVELARTLDYLGLVLLISVALGPDTWRPAIAGLGAGALTVCVLALLSRLFPAAFPATGLSAAAQFERLSYPFGYWNAVAAWGAMSVAFALTWSAHAASRLGRAAALAVVPAAGGVIYLTYSRAGIGGSVLAVLVVLALSRNRFTVIVHGLLAGAGTTVAVLVISSEPDIANATGTRGATTVLAAVIGGGAIAFAGAWLTSLAGVDRWSLPRQASRAVGLVAVIAALAAGVVFLPHLATRAWRSFKSTAVVTQSNDPSQRLLNLSGDRYLVWKSAFQEFDHRPLTGGGAGTFQFWWNRHGTTPEYLRDTHNIWLQNLAELGLPGLLLIGAIVLTAIWVTIAARRRARRRVSAGAAAASAAVLVVYVAFASVDWMWQSTAVTVLALAMIAAAGARLGSRNRLLGWRLRVPVVLFAAAACAVQLPGLLSMIDIRRSQQAERGQRANVALALANDAVGAAPWAASPYEQRGLILEAAGRYAAAAENLRRATENEPTNYAHWLILARIETEQGRLASAAHDLQQAHRLRPLSTVFAVEQLQLHPSGRCPTSSSANTAHRTRSPHLPALLMLRRRGSQRADGLSRRALGGETGALLGRRDRAGTRRLAWGRRCRCDRRRRDRWCRRDLG